MMKCTELAKLGERSVVEIRDMDTDNVIKYVVCTNFDNGKAYGSKWDWEHYFEIYGNETKELQLRNAMLYLYGINESAISFDRAVELSKAFLKEIRSEADEEDVKEFLAANNLTEDEAELFGVKDMLFPKKYKVVEVTFEQTRHVTVKVVMPDDEDTYSAEYYVDNKYDLSDSDDIEEDDWEVENCSVDSSDLTKEDYHDMYCSDEIWNDENFEEI